MGYRFEPDPEEAGASEERHAIDGFAYFIVTVDGIIAWASTSASAFLGHRTEHLVGHPFNVLTDATSFIESHTRTGVSLNVSFHHADGRLIAARMIVRPIKTHAAVQSFLVEVLGAAAAGQASTETLLPIITSAHRKTVELIYDRNLTLTSMSPRGEPFLGWNPDDIVGTFFLITNVPELLEDQARACALGQAIVDSGMRTVHDRMFARSASGELVPVHVQGEFLVDEDGRFAGLHASVTPEG